MAVTRGSTTSRGYGTKHQALRRQWKPKVDTGTITCAKAAVGKCLEVHDGRSPLIAIGTAWDLGHTDDRTTYTGPEHLRCNRSDGGAKGAAATHARDQFTFRDW